MDNNWDFHSDLHDIKIEPAQPTSWLFSAWRQIIVPVDEVQASTAWDQLQVVV